MAQLRERRATYADLERLPENMVGEILDGELVASPRPAIPHALASSALGNIVGGAFHRGREGPGGWWILDEPELHFGDDVVVPDLAGWRRERMPSPPATAAIELAPDWVCEILSESTARHDRRSKMRLYAQVRVGHYWIIDPIARTLEVYRLEGEGWFTAGAFAADEKVHAAPFDAIELDLTELWLPETPAT